MSNKLLKLLTRDLKPDNNLDAIRAFIIADSDAVKLTDEQARQKMIIDFTDEQLRLKQGILTRYSIAQIISNRFGLTHRTAQKYITLAEDLYSSSNPLNKRYRIQLRIERCEQLQELCIQKGELLVARTFETEIREYLKMYPDLKVQRTKRITKYILPGQLEDNATTVVDAVEILSTTLTEPDE